MKDNCQAFVEKKPAIVKSEFRETFVPDIFLCHHIETFLKLSNCHCNIPSVENRRTFNSWLRHYPLGDMPGTFKTPPPSDHPLYLVIILATRQQSEWSAVPSCFDSLVMASTTSDPLFPSLFTMFVAKVRPVFASGPSVYCISPCFSDDKCECLPASARLFAR